MIFCNRTRQLSTPESSQKRVSELSNVNNSPPSPGQSPYPNASELRNMRANETQKKAIEFRNWDQEYQELVK